MTSSYRNIVLKKSTKDVLDLRKAELEKMFKKTVSFDDVVRLMLSEKKNIIVSINKRNRKIQISPFIPNPEV